MYNRWGGSSRPCSIHNRLFSITSYQLTTKNKSLNFVKTAHHHPNPDSDPVTKIYTFGAGGYGKLGHGRYEDEWVPRLIEALVGKRLLEGLGLWDLFLISFIL